MTNLIVVQRYLAFAKAQSARLQSTQPATAVAVDATRTAPSSPAPYDFAKAWRHPRCSASARLRSAEPAADVAVDAARAVPSSPALHALLLVALAVAAKMIFAKKRPARAARRGEKTGCAVEKERSHVEHDGILSESEELVVTEDCWTDHLKEQDSDSAVGVCSTEPAIPLVDLCEMKSSGRDDETVATSSDCTTTGSINSDTGSGIAETAGERLLKAEEDPKGYLRPTISSVNKSVEKSRRSSAGRSPRESLDFTHSTTATSGRRHSLDTCRTCLF